MNREELVEKMCEAYAQVFGHCLENYDEATYKGLRKRMSVALDVAAGELLKSPLFHRGGSAAIAIINEDLASRRAQLEKVKTPEERVKNILAKYEKDHDTALEVITAEIIDALKEGTK